MALDDLIEQELNPQAMPQKMLDQLIENVKNAEVLESLPLCVRLAGQIHIISGHHRTRAARAAGLKHVTILLYEKELSLSQIKAKQLAHNTIFGKADPEIMRRVWQQINEVTAQFEAFVDPRLFKDLPEPVHFKPVDVNLAELSKAVLIVFLPSQKLDFDAAVEAITTKGQVDQVYLAHRETFEAWKDALSRVREQLEITSIPVAIAQMARLATERLDDLKKAENSE